MTESIALAIPDQADREPGAYELLRVWTTDAGERVALRVTKEIPVEGWGLLLSDLAKHAAIAHAQKGVGTTSENLRAIVTEFIRELQEPTDQPKGGITS